MVWQLLSLWHHSYWMVSVSWLRAVLALRPEHLLLHFDHCVHWYGAQFSIIIICSCSKVSCLITSQFVSPCPGEALLRHAPAKHSC